MRLAKSRTRETSGGSWNFIPEKTEFKHKKQKYHGFQSKYKHRIPLYWFTGVFCWKDKVKETEHGERDKEKFKVN